MTAATHPTAGLPLPCPFCGSKAEAQWTFGCESVDCTGCDATMSADTLAEAIAAWNKRALLPPTDQLSTTIRKSRIVVDSAGLREALEPCPFCGGEADYKLHDGDKNTWIVRCVSKDCPTWPSTDCAPLDDAIAAWNRRALLSAAPAEQHDAYVLELLVAAGFVTAQKVAEARALAQKVDPAEQPSGWRDIATAPKDGHD